MERELPQLLVVAAVIVLSLIDLFVRWLRKRAGGEGPRPLPPANDEAEYEMYEDNVPWTLPDAPPAQVPEPARSAPTSLPVRHKAALPMRSGDVSAPARLAATDARRVAALTARVRRPGGVVQGVKDARRAVVLAAVFGPPRAMDEYR